MTHLDLTLTCFRVDVALCEACLCMFGLVISHWRGAASAPQWPHHSFLDLG